MLVRPFWAVSVIKVGQSRQEQKHGLCAFCPASGIYNAILANACVRVERIWIAVLEGSPVVVRTERFRNGWVLQSVRAAACSSFAIQLHRSLGQHRVSNLEHDRRLCRTWVEPWRAADTGGRCAASFKQMSIITCSACTARGSTVCFSRPTSAPPQVMLIADQSLLYVLSKVMIVTWPSQATYLNVLRCPPI